MTQTLVAFCGAAVLLSMAPGPSTVVIVREAALSGRRAGLAALAGNEAGVLAWGVAAALGLSALLVASRVAYEAVRLVGAGVLLWMGVQALWGARRGREEGGEGTDRPAAGPVKAGGLRRSFRTGVVTAAANPKAGVFAVSFLPQFVPEGAPVPWALLVLAVLWVLIDLTWYLAVVFAVGAVRGLLRRGGVRRAVERVSGAVLIGLGVRLAFDGR